LRNRNRIFAGALIGGLLLGGLLAGCKRRKHAESTVSEAPSGPATMLSAADPRAAIQFTKGFYDVEDGQWRWSAREFSVALKPPSNAAAKGAELVLKFSIPDASITKLGAITLSAKVGSASLPAARYVRAGLFEYRADVPASELAGPMTTIDFTLDKALPPGQVDERELGVIVKIAGFEAK
jgi:hypothetical protein